MGRGFSVLLAFTALLSLVGGSGQAATPSQADNERPLGQLFTPLPVFNGKTVPDVYASPTPLNRQTPPVYSRNQNLLVPEVPPLGLLLAPLADDDPAQAAGPLQGPANFQIKAVQGPAATQIKVGKGANRERPLGLLLDQTEFVPNPQFLTGADASSASPGQARPMVPPPVRWSQEGVSSARPLGTLLIPGTYSPGTANSRPEPTPTLLQKGIPTPAIIEPINKLENDPSPPVDFSADEMEFDRESGTVMASGSVEVRYQSRSLKADKVSYNRSTNKVIAEGNVVIVEPTGEIIYGDKIDISGDLRDGFIVNIGVILQDRSRIAGSSATRSAGVTTELNHAVYSPCNLCKDDPDKAPVWQIKAVNVTHDKNAKVIEYQDAWLEFFGFPVFYTPYFRHADPTVKRKSGFLIPTFGNSSDLGSIFQIPYFWNISPNEDATVTPILMTAENPILAGEYRNRVVNGALNANGSLTASPDGADVTGEETGRHGVRGHIQSDGRFDINQAWRWGFDGNWTTDDTYMRRYGFGSPASLESQLYTESFKRRSYFSAKTITFQGLQADQESGQIPLVMPLVDFNYVGDKDRFGGNTNFDFNLLGLSREDGLDTRRISARSVWQRPFVGKFGDVYNVSFGLNSDLYHVNDLNRGANQSTFDGFSYRVTPEAALEWRMPFAKTDGNISQIFEPITSFIWSPYGGNPQDIPNEDSIELEFDDTNLFRTNRFSGLDRVEGGPRLVYGLKWGAFGSNGGKTNMFIGQSWRPKVDDTYVAGSGLEENFSDLVARMNISPGPYFTASYRTRFATENFAPNRQELSANVGGAALRLSGSYTFLDRQTGSEFSGREELSMTATSQIDRFWRAGFSGTRDIDASEMRTASTHLTYEDECVVFTSRLSRTFFQDRDLEPTDSIIFNLVLKTLGEVKTGGSLF